MWSGRLVARRRVGMKMLARIEPKAIARARRAVGFAREITVAFRGQRLKNPFRFWVDICFDHEIDSARLWRPEAEVRPARHAHFGADREPALERMMVHALNSPTGHGTVAARFDVGFR